MDKIEERILFEIKWRIDELSAIKAIPLLYKLTDYQRKLLEKHSIPAMYSLWEGYVLAVINILITDINSKNFSVCQVCQKLVARDIDKKFQLSNTRVHLDKKVEFITRLYGYLNNPMNLITKFKRESNMNFKTTNSIMNIFNLEQLPEDGYRKGLDKLLTIRNNIAHGDYTIPVDQELISELSLIVINAMYDLFLIMAKGVKDKCFLKDTMKNLPFK